MKIGKNLLTGALASILILGLSGCTQRLGQFTAVSTQNVRNLNYDIADNTKIKAEGDSCIRTFFIIPVGHDDDRIQRAIDDTIKNAINYDEKNYLKTFYNTLLKKVLNQSRSIYRYLCNRAFLPRCVVRESRRACLFVIKTDKTRFFASYSLSAITVPTLFPVTKPESLKICSYQLVCAIEKLFDGL